MSDSVENFDDLTPESIVLAAESWLGRPFQPLTIPFPSYINRVYELRMNDGTPVVIKFYRPNRWSVDALHEEHAFMVSCAASEVPVVAPLILRGGGTLGRGTDGIYFALYPKKSGRRFELENLLDWERLGRLTARLHLAGEQVLAVGHRPVLTPERSTAKALNNLLSHSFIPEMVKSELEQITLAIIDIAAPLVDEAELLAVHGDLHGGNIISRPDEGLFLIDFDDMAVAPAAQDMWLLLPDYANNCSQETEAMLRGYRELRDIETPPWELFESLRAMRMVYYLDWCARQKNDFNFERNFPEWGSPKFWRNELESLSSQLNILSGLDDEPEETELLEWL